MLIIACLARQIKTSTYCSVLMTAKADHLSSVIVQQTILAWCKMIVCPHVALR